MRSLFDSHCHVNEEKFDEDREEVLARMAEHGVTRYAVIGSDMATSAASSIPMRRRDTGRETWTGWPDGSGPGRPGPSGRSGWITTTT